MIRIINGTYGYRNPQTGVVEAKTVKSKPFTLPEDREDELVAAGVAEYVGEDVSSDGGNASDAPASAPDEVLTYSNKNTVAELKAIAEKLGIEVAERATKKQIIEALDAAKAGASDEDEESEDNKADDAESDGEDDGEDDGNGDAPDITAALPE